MKVKLSDIEKFFSNHKSDNKPWIIDSGSISTNTKLMVKTHILTLKNNKGNITFMPYWTRLLSYYNYCNEN